MREGDFSAAWQESDVVLAGRKGVPCWHLPRHMQYIWNGEPLKGKKVLVRCYHGLGDTLQFIRFIPLLQQEAGEVMVWVQPRLIPLLQYLVFPVQLFPLHDGTPDLVYDADIELMELPHYFRTTLQTLPPGPPYLDVMPAGSSEEKGRLAVGLVWQAGDWDTSRSIDFSVLKPLFAIPGISWYLLQAGAVEAGWDRHSGTLAGGANLLDDAQIIKSLDLVLSVDTMMAHLAGALAVPVWTLLPYHADWRWMDNGNTSPWYPSMRLFRQPAPGNWMSVVEEVQFALRRLLNTGRCA